MLVKTVACALLVSGYLAADSGQGRVSNDRLLATGRHMAADYEQTVQLVSDASVNGYTGLIAQRLARVAGLDSATVKIVNTWSTNARVFPGGFVYLDAGLILRQASDGDLAAAIAHLLAHATFPPRKAGMATIPLWFGCARFGPAGLRPARSNRQDEQDADRLARKYVEEAGYDTSVLDPEFDRVKERLRAEAKPQPASPTLKDTGEKPALKRPD
jgi:predicted Zn-dependent protease